MFNTTFSNISATSWWSVLVVEEAGVHGENHRTVASHWQTLSYNVVSSTPKEDWLIDFWCLTPLSAIFQIHHTFLIFDMFMFNLIKITSLTCSPYGYVMACEIWGNSITDHMWVTLCYHPMKRVIRRLWKCYKLKLNCFGYYEQSDW